MSVQLNAPLRPFVRCVRHGADLICTPWNYGRCGWQASCDEGVPVTIRRAFEFEVEETINPRFVNYAWTLRAVLKLAGMPNADPARWTLTRRWADRVHVTAAAMRTWRLELAR